jgi:thymidylate synthase (FAD)
MQVKLVSHTQPLEDGYNLEDLIVYCARVSNPKNQNNLKTAPRLIEYLIKHKHWSPFELADVTFEIKTSRAIAAQILRHRSFSFQEFSQRYAEATEFEPVELRLQGETNRQVGDEVVDPIIGNVEASFLIKDHIRKSNQLYKDLIEAGVAKESARMILPLTTESTLYMKGSVRSWIHYIEIRATEDTQKEHREIAQEIKNNLKILLPNISKALHW